MMHPIQRSVGYALRILIAGACIYGIWASVALARADYQFHLDTEPSLRAAIGIVPDGWQYYMRLAQFDPADGPELLATSLRLNRFDAQADIELGLQYEAAGDYPQAEKALLGAYEVDHTYLPRWTLANYYLRRDNIPAFWQWARSAAAMPADDIGALFVLCWRVQPDAQKVSSEILNDKPEMLRQFIPFLLGRTDPAVVAGLVPRLLRAGDPLSDRGTLFGIVNQLIAANEGTTANNVWRQMIAQGWVNAESSFPTNATFQHEPLAVGFDWTLPESEGLHSWPGSSGLVTEFSGSQPDNAMIADQAVALSPGVYSFAYEYHTSGIAPATGLHWQAYDPKTNTVLSESDDLSSDSPTRSVIKFTVPSGESLVRLRLFYRRAIGTTHISGTLNVSSTQILMGSQS